MIGTKWRKIFGHRVAATAVVVSETYNSTLKWRPDVGELSQWLKEHLSHQVSTIGSRAMDAEFIRDHIGGNWHRLYDGGHTIAGSWRAVSEALPDLGALEKLGTWANEYWKDFVTTRGMPIVTLDHANQVSEYLKHLDCVNFAQEVGGDLLGVSIYCNWADPAKLVASSSSSACSGAVYANVVAPLVGLIGLSRAIYLIQRSEQEELQALIAPALRGLTRSGATIMAVTVIPGGFLVHLSSGIVISLAHGIVWDKTIENKDAIIAKLKQCIGRQDPRNWHSIKIWEGAAAGWKKLTGKWRPYMAPSSSSVDVD